MNPVRRSGLLVLLALAALAVVLASWAGCAPDTGHLAETRVPGRSPTSDATSKGAATQAADADRPRVTLPPVPPPEADDAMSPLSVSISLPGGAVLPDAEVLVAKLVADWGSPPQVVASGRTGADGAATLALVPGRYAIRGAHADYQIVGLEFEHPTDGALDLEAGAGPRVVVTVVDAAGDPVADAVVWERHSHAGRVATTDAEGRADIGRVYPSNPFVHVQAPDFAEWSNYLFGTWDGRDVVERTVRLARALRVDVHVIEHDGSPASGVVVRSGQGSATTDSDGRATLVFGNPESLPGNRTWLRAETSDGRDAGSRVSAGSSDATKVTAGGNVIELQLPPPTPLCGIVRNARDLTPVPNARVFVQPGGFTTELLELATTDAEGTFSIPHVDRDGGVRALAFAAGLGPTGDAWNDHVEPDESGVFTLLVAPTMRLSGRAVDSAGEPVGSARAYAMTRDENAPLGVDDTSTTTATDGTFVLESVPAVPGVLVVVETPNGTGWHDLNVEIPATPGASFDVGDVAIPDGFDLDVPITDDDGVPLPSAIVWVRWRIVARGMPSAHRLVVEGRMDAVTGIPRDSAVADVTAPGCLPTTQRIDTNTEALVANRPCTVRGRVVRRDTAEPVAGVRVVAESKDRLYTMDGNHGSDETAADGTFAFGDVRRGRYAIRIQRDRTRLTCDVAEIDVAARETDLGTLQVE